MLFGWFHTVVNLPAFVDILLLKEASSSILFNLRWSKYSCCDFHRPRAFSRERFKFHRILWPLASLSSGHLYTRERKIWHLIICPWQISSAHVWDRANVHGRSIYIENSWSDLRVKARAMWTNKNLTSWTTGHHVCTTCASPILVLLSSLHHHHILFFFSIPRSFFLLQCFHIVSL